MAKQSQSDKAGTADVYVEGGELVARMDLTTSESKHLEEQTKEGELAFRAAALWLLRRSVLARRNEMAAEADAARAEKIAAARSPKGKMSIDVPVAKGSGKVKKIG